MKTEKCVAALAGGLLAFTVSLGSVGCLLTGFDLNMAFPERLPLVCGITALICSLLFQWKWGGAGALCLLALWAGYLWHRGEAGTELLQLLYRISHVYDRAYGWGVLQLVDTPWNVGAADLPLQVLGCVIAMAVCRCVCGGKRTWPAVVLAAAPLLLCLVVTDTVPEEKYLFALLFGLVLLVLSASVRRSDGYQSVRLLWLTALPVAAALILLFHLVPQEGYVNQPEEVREKILSWVESLPEKVEDTTKEIAAAVSNDDSETVNLKTLGRQSSLAYPVMEVTADCGGTIYLRSQDFDSYTGTGWTASRIRSEDFSYDGEDAGQVQIVTRSVQDNWYLPYYPTDGENLIGGALANSDREKSYSVGRSVLPDDWRQLVAQRSQGRWESEIVFTATLERTNYLDSVRYLTLPNATLERAKALVETILGEETSATEKADAIAAYVRSSAEYDRDTERMPSEEEDFALWFLEESDTGYCVHFATAAVVLLRAAKIPARYVTGYMVTCNAGETVTVTADTAHAWTEYYEPQLACWIPLEATPPDGLPQTRNATETEAESRETAPSEAPTLPERTEPPASIPVPSQTQQVQTQGQEQKILIRIPVFWLWLAVFLLLTECQRRVRMALRSRKTRGTPNQRALAHWRYIELLAKLQGKVPPKGLEALAQKAKFSQHTLTGEELARMEDYIDGSVEKLKQRPWYLRLVHRYVFAAY